jgi:biotin synthase-related radical SAM superfamily protein
MDMLSRVSWPAFPTSVLLTSLQEAFEETRIKRVCIQAINYAKVVSDVISLLKAIHSRSKVQVSVCCQPLNRRNLLELAEAGAERIGIPLDAAQQQIFDGVKGRRVKGPFDWNRQFELLVEAVRLFGKRKVSTHLIVGLGETEKEMANIIQECVDLTVLPALFAFTPIPGTSLENRPQPALQSYRRIQIMRHLIVHRISKCDNMRFDAEDRVVDFGVSDRKLMETVQTGKPFLTSGCPDCNRPFYNEKPSGPIYNFSRQPTEHEISEIMDQAFCCSQ